MRTYTLAFSVVVHVMVASALIVAPIVATDVLPEPRRAMAWIQVTATTPPSVPPPQPAGARRRAPSAASQDAAPVHVPDAIAPEIGLEAVDARGSSDGVEGGVHCGSPIDTPCGAPGTWFTLPPDEPPPPPPQPTQPVRIGGAITPPRKIHDVRPVYPAVAQSARKEGIVILEAEIGEDGRVRGVRVLRSVALLDDAAMEAVRQWQFSPTLLNGKPVPVVMTVTVAFTLR